jgi:uncharacterized caspase-like protein
VIAAARYATSRAVFHGVLASLCLVLLTLASPAQERALRGVALVIGQSDYEHLPKLPNPANDAKALDRLLEDLGFEVDTVADGDRKKLTRSLERFIEDAEDADVAMIYYSGHGIEAGGENYLIPVDAGTEAPVRADSDLVAVSTLLRQLQAAVPVTIVLLDACRSNPFPPGAMVKRRGESQPVTEIGLGAPRGAAALNAPKPGEKAFGTLLGFAAAPGQAALDGEPGGNSPYAAALLKHLSASGFSFADVMTMVSEEVYLKTDARQVPWTNTSLRRQLYFGGAADEDEETASIRGERRSLLLAISSMAEVKKTQVASTARRSDIPMDALFAMLRAVGSEIPEDPEQLSRLLEEQALRVKALVDERETLRSADGEIERLSELATQALREGALDAAIALRQRAKQRVASLSTGIDQAEADLRARRIEFAAVFAASAETYSLAYESRRAAEDFGKAFEQVDRWDDALALKYKLAEAKAWSEQASYKADDAATARALDAYRLAARLAPADVDPESWAQSQSGLAMAMWSKAERQNGNAALEETAKVLEAAIAAPAIADRKDDLAALRADLALVLMSIGQRQAGTATLQRAAEEIRLALAVKTRAAAPHEWARLQNHLGNVLFFQGQREQSLRLMEEAAEAYRAALTVTTRETDPLGWANTQNNLGLAIGEIGDRDPDSARLLEAVGYLKDALEVRTRDVAPVSWAETVSNLGATYYELGIRVPDQIQWYKLAAASFTQAAGEITRERDPLKWAGLHDNLGMSLASIGHRTDDLEKLHEAAAAYHLALTERTRASVPLEWASTMNNIGNVEYRVGVLGDDQAALQRAVVAYEAALEERTREQDPVGWAQTQGNLANALSDLSAYEAGIGSLVAALGHYQLALNATPRDINPIAYSDVQYNRAMTLIDLGKRSGDLADFEAAAAALDASQAVYTDAGEHQYDQHYEDQRVILQMAILQATLDAKAKEMPK